MNNASREIIPTSAFSPPQVHRGGEKVPGGRMRGALATHVHEGMR
jgi:hypothetical protein